ncbi:hypothetical protein KBAHV46_32470 [Aeromonas hydrophila]|nr:hypothetical protein KBAHV27_32410 [Aeromonas hydrophila]CAD7547806.1 hypothetical protein KBAHV46_32470 [Aeromonas hydrophila]CAD7547810.1 hypothetical protein KBAHV42_32520 [Aeromonas hydrophila]CAD7549100.1 hypothetical protein KBAHV01_32410 [Aeromonas hydrophila]CAD7549517.1 hypothetical protein KBAHV22_32560 [Aeromonas hydrophila]
MGFRVVAKHKRLLHTLPQANSSPKALRAGVSMRGCDGDRAGRSGADTAGTDRAGAQPAPSGPDNQTGLRALAPLCSRLARAVRSRARPMGL